VQRRSCHFAPARDDGVSGVCAVLQLEDGITRRSGCVGNADGVAAGSRARADRLRG